ncbi:MAG: HutD family protein [Crocinitomicaceae bacterium]|jgi:environmental stress-induced protein Ves
MEIIKSFKTTDWSGGKTTEMFIYPTNSNYTDRNFDFRISSATVEVEESDFTYLTGFHRLLTIIDGQIELYVNNETPFVLEKDISFWFLGSDKVKSRGIVRDFNVIFSNKYEVQWRLIKEDEFRKTQLNQGDFLFYFLIKGNVKMNEQSIYENELVCFNFEEYTEFENTITFENDNRLYEIFIQLRS